MMSGLMRQYESKARSSNRGMPYETSADGYMSTLPKTPRLSIIRGCAQSISYSILINVLANRAMIRNAVDLRCRCTRLLNRFCSVGHPRKLICN